jgi:hypothetical protein
MKDSIKYKEEIVQKWLDAVLSGYQPETARFIKKNRDPFKNPVGSVLHKSLDVLAGLVLDGMDHDLACRALTDVLSVMAVQDFSPSEAVRFIPALRGIVREFAGAAPDETALREARIDELLLLAFDIYMERREKIFGLRVREIRSGMFTTAEEKE